MTKNNNIFRRFFAFLKFKKKPHFAQEDIDKWIKRIRRNTKYTKKRKDEIEMVFLKLISVNFVATLDAIYEAALRDRLHDISWVVKGFKSRRTKRVLKKKRSGNK